MIHQKSVAILLRPDIRILDANCTAGTERVAINDAMSLHAHNHTVMFCSAAHMINMPKFLQNKRLFYPINFLDVLNRLSITRGFILPRVAGRLYTFFEYIFELIYVFQFIFFCRRYQILYSFQTPLVGAFLPKKTIVMCQDASPRTSLYSVILRSRFKKIKFVCCSQSLRKDLISLLPDISPKEIAVLYNAVDTIVFSPKRNSSIREKATLKIGYVGTWAQEKGISILLDTIKLIEKDGLSDSISFYIAGDIDIWDRSQWQKKALLYLKKNIEHMGAQSNVHIIGKLQYDQLPKFYHAMDYVLFPSLYREPFGNVIIEAMSCGTPVIAFSRGAASEIIDAASGIIVRRITATSVKDCLYTLLRLGSNQYNRLSNASRETIVSSFSAERRWPYLIGLLSSRPV